MSILMGGHPAPPLLGFAPDNDAFRSVTQTKPCHLQKLQLYTTASRYKGKKGLLRIATQQAFFCSKTPIPRTA